MIPIFKKKLDRRTVLKGMLGASAVGVGLPLLDIFLNDNGTALADGSALPRRFAMWIWGNGVIPERWVPPTDGPDYELSPEMSLFGDMKEQITVVSGTKVFGENLEAHFAGPAGLLSGHPLRSNGQFTFDAPSVDVIIGNEIGSDTRFRSLETAALRNTRTFSVNGPNDTNPPELDPLSLYMRVFSEGFTLPGEDPIIDPKWQLRRSVLSAVQDQVAGLQRRLGSHDLQRLDQHFTNVRELELRLLRLEEEPPDLASCGFPLMPLAEYPDNDGREQVVAKHRAHADVLAMAMACDQTRVCSMIFTGPVTNVWFPNKTMEHHNLTHNELDGPDGFQVEVDDIVTLMMGEYAYFCERMSMIPEGDGSMLDNMLVFGTTDCSRGRDHSIENYPILLGGSACGTLRTGLHYRSPGENASKVMLSVLRAMGLNRSEWGVDVVRTTDSLSAIET